MKKFAFFSLAISAFISAGQANAAPAEVQIEFVRNMVVSETIQVLNCNNTGSTISFTGNQIALGNVYGVIALSNNFKGTKTSPNTAQQAIPILAIPEGSLDINKQPNAFYDGVGGNPYIRFAPPSARGGGFDRATEYTVDLGRCVTPSSKPLNDTSAVTGEAVLKITGLECKVTSTKFSHGANSLTNPAYGSVLFSNNEKFEVHDSPENVYITLQIDASNAFTANLGGVKSSNVGGNPMVLLRLEGGVNDSFNPIQTRIKNPKSGEVPVYYYDTRTSRYETKNFMPLGRCKDLM